ENHPYRSPSKILIARKSAQTGSDQSISGEWIASSHANDKLSQPAVEKLTSQEKRASTGPPFLTRPLGPRSEERA
ncbi:hypothetical protein ACWGS9_34700, partial [Bradyrhizobium sp. Arg314]